MKMRCQFAALAVLCSVLFPSVPFAQVVRASLPSALGAIPRVILGSDSTALVYLAGYDRAYLFQWRNPARDPLLRVLAMPLIGGGFASDSGYHVMDRSGTGVWLVRSRDTESSPRAVRLTNLPKAGFDRYTAAILPNAALLTAPYIKADMDLSQRIQVEHSGETTVLFEQARGRSGVLVSIGEDSGQVTTTTQARWLDDGPRWALSSDAQALARISAVGSHVILESFGAEAWRASSCRLPLRRVEFSPSLRKKAVDEIIADFEMSGGFAAATKADYQVAVSLAVDARKYVPIARSITVSKSEVVLQVLSATGAHEWRRFDAKSCVFRGLANPNIAAQNERWAVHASKRGEVFDIEVVEKRARR